MGLPEGDQMGFPEGVPVGLPEGVPDGFQEGVPVKLPEGVEPTKQGPTTYGSAEQDNIPKDAPQVDNIPPDPPSTGPRRQNIGTWKDGPAKIRISPMDNESYKLHILLDNSCDSPAAFVTNQGHITIQQQPQWILKSTLFACMLLQDPWVNYNDLYGCIAMDLWDSTQMNDSDSCLLAINTSVI